MKRVEMLVDGAGKRRAPAMIAGALVVAAIVVSVVWAGQRATLPNDPSSVPASASARPAPAPAGGFVEFRQPQLGIGLDYPADWTSVATAAPQVQLLLVNGSAYSFQLRTVELEKPVGTAELPEAKKVTDEIVSSGKSVTMLAQPTQITVGGLPGYFYFYTFADPVTGQLGAHSHYFLFKGNTMITMVCQAIPTDQFRAVATVFDRIAESFRVF